MNVLGRKQFTKERWRTEGDALRSSAILYAKSQKTVICKRAGSQQVSTDDCGDSRRAVLGQVPR